MSEEVFRAIEERWSCRAFESTPLEQETIKRLLGAMLRAPSAGNAQPWHFYVVTNESTRKNLSEAAYGQQFVRQAPVVFVVCVVLSKAQAAYGQRGSSLYCLQDTAAAVENLLLAAESMGLGSCWVGAFDESRAGKVLGLPSHRRPVAMVPVGKPAAPKTRTRRESEEKTVTWVR
ncbi:MAG: nitroreductase family protein [Candidatus Eisenbacteria bacterium]